MGVNIIRNRVKRVALILSILQTALLGFGTFLLLQHPKALTTGEKQLLEFPHMVSDRKSVCNFDACKRFNGENFGPTSGWILLIITFVISVIQLITVIIYQFELLKKNNLYTRLTTGV